MRKSIEATNDSSWSYFAVSLIGFLSSQIKNMLNLQIVFEACFIKSLIQIFPGRQN